jgi:hypothetical protein
MRRDSAHVSQLGHRFSQLILEATGIFCISPSPGKHGGVSVTVTHRKAVAHFLPKVHDLRRCQRGWRDGLRCSRIDRYCGLLNRRAVPHWQCCSNTRRQQYRQRRCQTSHRFGRHRNASLAARSIAKRATRSLPTSRVSHKSTIVSQSTRKNGFVAFSLARETGRVGLS